MQQANNKIQYVRANPSWICCADLADYIKCVSFIWPTRGQPPYTRTHKQTLPVPHLSVNCCVINICDHLNLNKLDKTRVLGEGGEPSGQFYHRAQRVFPGDPWHPGMYLFESNWEQWDLVVNQYVSPRRRDLSCDCSSAVLVHTYTRSFNTLLQTNA